MYTIAKNIIKKLGGHQRVSEITGADISRVYRWTYPEDRGGTDGRIPAKHQAAILNAANAGGIELTLSDIIPSNLNLQKSQRT